MSGVDTWTTKQLTEERTSDRVPPRGFIQKMRRALCDDALDAIWNEKKSRWCIVRNVMRYVERNGIFALREIVVPVCTVKNPDGSYRQLDDRVIDWLKLADSRGIDMSALMAEAHEQERKREEREDQRMVEQFKDRMRDNPKALREAMEALPSPHVVKSIQNISVDGFKPEAPIEPAFGGASSA